ncbi:hypothetical protein U2G91_15685 [Rhodococcoides fascians]|uniref:hypothetical protein n=1 Tax=Rhodococcoides fascians TaxID=1828 RepID=UPI002ACE091C|nr:hypothetical protein [Rhodococcus fascians]WQH26544.1 hypothetical protein U2G91_15685 [Rhodococcus fascians]
MADIGTPLQRVGHGRWAIVPIGILWVTDAGVIGFQPPPKGNAKDIETLIANALDAGKDANTAFDEIATVLGAAAAKAGDVATWTVDRRPVFQ